MKVHSFPSFTTVFDTIVTPLLSALFILFFLGQAHAATITVNSTDDSGSGTLRQAILDAGVSDTIDFDGITFPPGSPATIILASALPIDKPIIIDGNGDVIIDANGTDRVFLISDGTAALINVSLTGLKLTGGIITGSGGAIYNLENLTLSNSIIDTNTATTNGGGIYNDTSAVCIISNSVISGNSAPNGGGLYNNSSSTCTITNTTINANSATNYGGGIYNKSSTFTATGSTLSTNHATTYGGAIYISGGNTTLTNSTVSGNSANTIGGGLFGAGTVNVRNSTIAYNTASKAGGIYINNNTLNLVSSIVSYNAAATDPDISPYNTVTINADHSLVTTGTTVTGEVNGNIVGQEAMLDILKNNGGPTMTHMLLSSSPCIGTGSNPLVLATDQRGGTFSRQLPDVTGIDMGAVETASGLAGGTWVVDTKDDVVDSGDGVTSLREAISNAPGGAVITFDPLFTDPAFGTITLSGSELVINKTLSIDGDSRVSINGGGISRIFSINDRTSTATDVQLSGLVLSGGAADNGAAIWNAEKLTLTAMTLTNNTATVSGGAIYNSAASGTIASVSVLLQNSTVTGNTAAFGGGVYNSSQATIIASNSTFSNNSAVNGGATYNQSSTLTATGSTFNANSVTNRGGAIYVSGGSATLTNCTVSDNFANSIGSIGGGIFGGGTINIRNSTIAYNTSVGKAGGIYIDNNTLNLVSSIVGYNAAATDPDISPYNTVTINADHSLVTTGTTITGGVNGNIVGQNPLLFPLGNYGGPTQTHALMDLSPCIDNGSDPLVLDFDQRGTGFPRIIDTVDMGAVEYAANTTLNVATSGNGSGTVTGTPGAIDCSSTCSYSYDPNTTVTLTANPGTETVFSGWSAPCSGTGTCTVTMDQTRSVTATFTLNQYSVTATAGSNGSLDAGTPSPKLVDYGFTTQFIFNANTGYHVASISGCGISYTNTDNSVVSKTENTGTITENCPVAATFAINQYSVTATAGSNGSLDAGTTSPQTVNYGFTTQFTLNADTGYHVASISGCGISYTNTDNSVVSKTETTGTITENCPVAATFAINQYTVRADSTGNGYGTISSNVGGISYSHQSVDNTGTTTLDHNTSITITANANTGSTVTLSDCDSNGGTTTAATCTFANLNGDKSVTATFTLNTYSLTIVLEGSGTGTVTSLLTGIDCGTDCEETYDYGREVTLTAAPEGKGKFKGWSGACTGTETTCVITVDQALSVGALFDNSFPWTMFLPSLVGQGGK